MSGPDGKKDGGLPKKERLKLPQQIMPEQPPRQRIHNMNEVPLGFSPEQAVAEAARCLECPKAKCIAGCPVGIDIPAFIRRVAAGDFAAAVATVRERNLLPAICGRVCPQEDQCQVVCAVTTALKSTEKSVSIGKLERFVADWERAHGGFQVPEPPVPTGKKIGIVGSGPAGLTVAGDLVRWGHAVTVFEALHRPGGVLTYGIPEFRLPKEIVYREVEYLEALGVQFRYNFVVGKTRTLGELMTHDAYDALFIGTGAGLPKFLDIPGENLCGVYSANEYLTRSNLMRAYEFPRSDTPLQKSAKVVVVGGGNVAMDAARTALRLGAAQVIVVYRRSEKEMPARIEEVHHAKEEGICFHLLVNPTRILADDADWVAGIELQRMELGEPDASGRRRPVPVAGSEFVLDCDTVIVSIGNDPNPLIPQTTPGIRTTKWGNIIVDAATQRTSIRGVFAGGDIVLGAGEGRPLAPG